MTKFKGLNRSLSLFQEAQRFIPGGVNSPVRAFKSVGMNPPFISKGEGSKIYDVDGNSYIDYVGSWGPLILGHRHPEVVEALRECLEKGTSFGAPTEVETELASFIVQIFPAVDMIRMVNSGTEATMSALRLARAYTGRDKIVKFEGCYHGHADHLLIKAGSGALTLGVPTSPGIHKSIADTTISAPYNDIETLNKIFLEKGEQIACVILEPVAGNMGCIPPQQGFLEGVRKITRKYGSLLIFDEVMTGFRVAFGGAQLLYNIEPDLSTFGKIIGGGLPVGAYGGKKEIMELVAPQGPVYQAGTLSGNPLAMTAGLTTLKILQREGTYQKIESKSLLLEEGFKEASQKSGVPISFNRVGSMFTAFFTDKAVVDLETATTSNTNYFANFFKSMLEQGIYLGPSQFEASFISLSHSEEDILKTINAMAMSLK